MSKLTLTHTGLAPQSVGHQRTFRDLLREAWQSYERDYARYFAVAIVYYALVSLVPLLLLLLATVGLLLRSSSVAASIEHQVLSSVALNFGEPLRKTLEHSLGWLQDESGFAAAISVVGLFFTASALFRHLRMTFRAIWKHAPPLVSGPLRVIVVTSLLERMIAFAIVLAGGALLLGSLAAIAVVQWLNVLPEASQGVSRQGRWLLALPGTLVTVFLIFALLFKVLPPVRLGLRRIWLASALCAGAWVIGAEVLTLFGSYLSQNMGAYGALGGVLVIMLWMKVMSEVLFFGAELCKVQSAPTDAAADHRLEDQVRG